MSTTNFKLTAASKLKTAIEQWGTSGKEYQKLTDDLLFQSLLHFHTHGDTVFMTAMIKGAPKGARANAMAAWFREFSPCAFDKKSGQFKKNKANGRELLMDNEAEGTRLLTLASETPYYDLIPEPEIKEFDFNRVVGRIKKLVADMQQAIDSGNVKDGDIEKLAGFKAKLEKLAA